MDKESSRNTIIFLVCAMAMLLIYDQLVMAPARRARAAQTAAAAAASHQAAGLAPPIAAIKPMAQALAESPRVRLATPALTGSVALKGARLDQLFLGGSDRRQDYRDTLAKDSPLVELLRPGSAEFAYFATTGWAGQNVAGLPGPDTVWSVIEGDVLAPGKPLTLGYEAGTLSFHRKIEVDDKYMFTVTDEVINNTDMPVQLAAYATVERHGLPPIAKNNRAREGYVRVLGEKVDKAGKPTPELRLKLRRYRDWRKDGSQTVRSIGGWLGVSDKYWLTAIIPVQREDAAQSDRGTARMGVTTQGGLDLYDATFTNDPVTVGPAGRAEATHRIFAGPKRYSILNGYEKSLRTPRFSDAIDWGTRLWFISKPFFLLIEWIYGFVHNFGLAILMVTVLVKIVFFFPANMSFASMTKMKKVQPQMDALKERYKDDPAQLQQAMMRLYKEEKVNPLLGCLPMVATIPVFLALFQVLNTTIEMRHAPFIGWIHDLSAPDPTNIWNLFGLIPWDPASTPLIGGILGGTLHLSVWAIAYGATMSLTQSMSPASADPTQKMIMRWMPIFFTFILAGFPAGLLIYYSWSNLLTIIQQYVIMRRYKVDNPIDGIWRRITGKPAPA